MQPRRIRHDIDNRPPLELRTAHGRLRRLAAQRPLTTFLVLGFSLAYTLAFVWGLAYHGVIPGGGLADALHIAPDEVAGGMLLLALLPAALFVTWAASGAAGVRALLRRCLRWRVNVGWWLTVLLGLPVLTVGLALLLGDTLRPVDAPSLIISQLGFLVVNLVVINSGRRRRGPASSRPGSRSGTTGPSRPRSPRSRSPPSTCRCSSSSDQPVTPSSLAAAFASTCCWVSWSGRSSRSSGAEPATVCCWSRLLHSVFNRTNNENGLAATLLDGDARGLTMLVAVVVLTGVTAVVVRSRLSRAYGARLAQQSASLPA